MDNTYSWAGMAPDALFYSSMPRFAIPVSRATVDNTAPDDEAASVNLIPHGAADSDEPPVPQADPDPVLLDVFSVDMQTKELKPALALLAAGMSTRATLPILKTIMLEAGPDGVSFTSTNLECSITFRPQQHSTHTWGAGCLDGRTLKGLIDKWAPGAVRIIADPNTKAGSVGGVPVSYLPAEDFPSVGRITPVEVADLPVAVLVGALERALVTASKDDSRPQLAGVLVRTTENSLIVASSDGFRLYEEEIQGAYDGEHDMIIPDGSCKLLIRALKAVKTGNVTISASRQAGTANPDHAPLDSVRFSFGPYSMLTRLVQGQFPNYSMIIPKRHDALVSADVKQAVAVLDLLATLQPDADILRMYSAPDGMRFGVIPGGHDGRDLDKVSWQVVPGMSLDSGSMDDVHAYNINYLRDALISCGDRAVLELQSKGAPMLLRPASVGERCAVIMPMHLGAR